MMDIAAPSVSASPLPSASAVRHGHAQDAVSHRGRKYKAPPDTSHIEVVVTKR